MWMLFPEGISKVNALEMEMMFMVVLCGVHLNSNNCLCMCNPSVCRTLAHASNGWDLNVPSSA